MQPDLIVACDVEENTNEKGRYMGTPVLVIEILSPGTRTKDMVDKLNTFMISGVKEYWIVDPKQEIVLVYGFEDLEIDHFTTFWKRIQSGPIGPLTWSSAGKIFPQFCFMFQGGNFPENWFFRNLNTLLVQFL